MGLSGMLRAEMLMHVVFLRRTEKSARRRARASEQP